MYRKQHHGQLSIEAFHLPFDGTLDHANSWVLLTELLPCKSFRSSLKNPAISAIIGKLPTG
jgi:hypothetical protein